MITNVTLEEKYRVQRRLSRKAKETGRDYLAVVEDGVVELFKARGCRTLRWYPVS